MAKSRPSELPDLARRHLVVGWWGLALFLSLGLVLEALHGFKVSWYLNVSVEARRLMWTLAHAHGTLLSLINIVVGVVLLQPLQLPATGLSTASRCLLAATALLPGGFFVGGLFIYGDDPGPGVLLVPAGGVLLLVAVLIVARRISGIR